jgi:uncharacterized protein YidB (DUF937 family)
MGLLDSVIGALGQAQGQAQQQTADSARNAGGSGSLGDLGSLLGGLGGGAAGAGGGGQADLLAGIIGMLGAGGQGGGLAALVQKFQQAGLGDVVASWIASGPNKPISGDQLGRVLGADALGGAAQQAGVSPQDLMGQLAQLLPQLVDQLTPDGQLPEGGQLSSGGMENLANMLGGSLKR